MGTLAATFAAKIRNLHDYQLRLLNNAVSPPSGNDIANTLKYFSQTLLGVLKDVNEYPLLMIYEKQRDARRLGIFPSLDYRGLYSVLVQLLEVTPLVQNGVEAFGQSLLCALLCVLPFLEHELIESLPSLVASSIVFLPQPLHGFIIHTLCYYLLPLALGKSSQQGFSSTIEYSIPGIIMAVLQYTDNTAYHCQLMESLMSLKHDVAKDLLCVVGSGTLKARVPAAHLLFYYWPALNPTLYDRRGVHVKFNGWKPMLCQREGCSGSNGEAEVIRLCFDHRVTVTQSSIETGPILGLCEECSEEIKRHYSSNNREEKPLPLIDVLLPMQQISILCDNKSCRSTEKSATITCFSPECAEYNGQRPIRYCSQCHSIRHNNRRGGDHVVHSNLTPVWEMNGEMQSYTVGAIVSLLKEAQPYHFEKSNDSTDRLTRAGLWQSGELGTIYAVSLEERRLLSRYGVWILAALCKPVHDAPKHIIGRIVGALFHWFDTTSGVTDDQAVSVLEPLKSDLLHEWIVQMQKIQSDTLVECLLPWPPTYSRVGGNWDACVSKSEHVKEGFNRLFSLVPYDIITPELWNEVIPHWLEAIVNIVPPEEWSEFRITLNKLLDPDMSPLGFDVLQMYKFFSVRFQGTKMQVQEQALRWVQLLSSLQIAVPITVLITIFQEGVTTCKMDYSGDTAEQDSETEEIRPISPVSNLSSSQHYASSSSNEKCIVCHVLMLDVLLEQLELQEVEANTGLHVSSIPQMCLTLLKDMLSTRQQMLHSCTAADCSLCTLVTYWYELAAELIAYFAPLQATQVNETTDDDAWLEAPASHHQMNQLDKKSEHKAEEVQLTVSDVKSAMQNMAAPAVLTARMETVSELDLAPILPEERVVKAIAKAVTLTEMDVASAKAEVARATLMADGDSPAAPDAEGTQSYWITSAGKFKFTLEELPSELQLIYGFLKELFHINRADTQRHLLRCVETISLHCEALSKAAREHRGFLIWAQENLTVGQLWNILECRTSHVGQIAVSLLLHCLALPGASDVFWKIMDAEYHSQDWKVRFAAVERTILMFQFMDTCSVKQSSVLQSVLCNAFCFLVSRSEDSSTPVTHRAVLLLDNLNDNALATLLWCLEQQFDNFIADRPLLIQSVLVLLNHPPLAKRRVLSWKFFLNRFDAMFLEAQLNLQKTGEIAYPRDLKNSDMNSEVFAKKLQRAKDALSRANPNISSGIRNAMRSLNCPNSGSSFYKKPGSFPPFNQAKGHQEKSEKLGEKTYSRQSSSAVLKQRGSKTGFGLDGHTKGSTQGSSDDAYLVLLMQKCSEAEDFDGETLHLLITAFMQFIAKPEFSQMSDDKFQVKIQNLVLKHLSLLLGYSPIDRAFFITPQKLRCSSIFNAFLASLPQVLDHNLAIGTSLFSLILSLLVFCPTPPSTQNYSTWQQFQNCYTYGSTGNFGISMSNNANDKLGHREYKPTYSLWFLEPFPRKMWLQAVLVILYKYRYDQGMVAPQMQSIVRIVLNTLEAQFHQCYRQGIPLNTPSVHGNQTSMVNTSNAAGMRTRDTSQASFASELDTSVTDHDVDTNRTFKGQRSGVVGQGVGSVLGIAGLGWGPTSAQVQVQVQPKPTCSRREVVGSVSSDGDFEEADIDGVELEAIPESPKGHRTELETETGSSNKESFGDLEVFADPALQQSRPAGDLAIAACVKHPPAVYEAHLVVTSGKDKTEPELSPGKLRQRKKGISAPPEIPIELQKLAPEPTWPQQWPQPLVSSTKPSSLRTGEECVYEKCPKCGTATEEFSEEEMGLCIVILSTYIHREPTLAAPLIPEILRCVAKLAGSTTYSWQVGSNTYVPGNVGSTGRQFLRCVLHQLTPNKVFYQLFQTQIPESFKMQFFKTISSALSDFAELNPVAPLQLLFEALNEQKQLSNTSLSTILPNAACYFECLTLDVAAASWTVLLPLMEIFFGRLVLFLPSMSGNQSNGLLRLMICAVRVCAITNLRCILDPFTKILVYIILHWNFQYKYLVELCHVCYRAFNKEKEKFIFTRTVVDELVLALKFKSTLPDTTFALLIHFVLQDAGGSLPPNSVLETEWTNPSSPGSSASGSQDPVPVPLPTGAFDCVRPHLNDIAEFLSDVHTLTKLKSVTRASSAGPGLHEDTLGGTIKAGAAQLLALELARNNGKDNRCVLRYLPWLYNPPSAVQQGPREYLECVSRVRMLSWLLLSTLQNIATNSASNGSSGNTLNSGGSSTPCFPLPPDISCHIADHLQGIFAGFVEQSKASVLHMSSLFHSFLLCQLWTIYLEYMATQNPATTEQQSTIYNVLIDYWSKITPAILQLVSHSSMFAEMVNLHFLSLMEALAECRSTLLSLLLPLWGPVLHAHSGKLPSHLEVRYQTCIEGISGNLGPDFDRNCSYSGWLGRWLQGLQFKMGQIEVQSSTASQFYNV